MHRCRSIGTALAAISLAGILAACGTNAPTPASSHDGAGPPETSTSSSPASASTATAPLHGIILGVETAANAYTLEALDPTSGADTAERTFTSDSANIAIYPSDPGFVWRQAFNADLTDVAATGPQNADGSSDVGYVDVTGNFHQLSSSTSNGYGTPLQKSAIGFNPSTGYLWYQTPQGNGSQSGQFGYVDPATGKDTLIANSSGFQNGAIGGYNDRVYFGANGYGPVDIASVPYSVFLPNGNEVDIDQIVGGYYIGPDGQVDHSADPTPQSPTDIVVPWMKIPVNNTTFLATDATTTQLFLATMTPGLVTLRALLPDSSRTVGDVVASPDGTEAAFVATAGSESQLYTISLTAVNAQPHLLSSFDGNLGSGYGLLAWLP